MLAFIFPYDPDIILKINILANDHDYFLHQLPTIKYVTKSNKSQVPVFRITSLDSLFFYDRQSFNLLSGLIVMFCSHLIIHTGNKTDENIKQS